MKKRYQFEVLRDGIDTYIQTLASEEVLRAWRKIKFTVLAGAWVDFGVWEEGRDKEQALALAWEDMAVAFAGYGRADLTGVIIRLWTAAGKDNWPGLRKALDASREAAEEATPKVVPRRYFKKYRLAPCRSPLDGFNMPSIAPVSGFRLRTWAKREGYDPDLTESQMLTIEEYERMGLIEISNAEKPEIVAVPIPARPGLRLIIGGGDE